MSDKKVKIELLRSLSGHPAKHVRVLKALGMTKINRVREFPDNPVFRGMINKIGHMVKIVE